MTLLDSWSNVNDNEWLGDRSESAVDAKTATAQEVLSTHLPMVYKVARRVLGNEADADDVTQDVMFRALHKFDTVRDMDRLGGWLHRVTVNASLQHRRKAIRHRKLATGGSLARRNGENAKSNVCPVQRLLNNERREVIERAIARLPKMYREVYLLADSEQLSNPEIGEILNLGVAAVKSRLHRARSMMRQALAPYF